MKDPHAWQAHFPTFSSVRVAQALEILLESAAGLKKEHDSEHEDLVTQRLRLRIRKNPRFRIADFDLLSQFEVYDPRDRESDLRGILDLSFHLLNVLKPVPYFAIEAKRLRYRSASGDFKTGNSEYVTEKQGMRCFTDDRYAEGYDAGAMLGYVYDGDIDSAKNGINLLIAKHAQRLKCRKPHQLAASHLPKPSSGIDETIHALKGRDFRLFHIFLSV